MNNNICVVRIGKSRTKIANIETMKSKGYPIDTYRTASKMVVGHPCVEKAIVNSNPPICSKHLTEILHLGAILQDIRKKPGTISCKINGTDTGNLSSLSNYCQLSTNREANKGPNNVEDNNGPNNVSDDNISNNVEDKMEKKHLDTEFNSKSKNINIVMEPELHTHIQYPESVYNIIRDRRVYGGYCAKHKDTGILYELLPSLRIGKPLIM